MKRSLASWISCPVYPDHTTSSRGSLKFLRALFLALKTLAKLDDPVHEGIYIREGGVRAKDASS